MSVLVYTGWSRNAQVLAHILLKTLSGDKQEMSYGAELPDEVLDAVTLLRELGRKTYLSKPEREEINRAKLRIAFWACRSENVVASRENLTYVLGPDAPEIMGAYDQYLEREEDREAREEAASREAAAKRKKKADGPFWKNA